MLAGSQSRQQQSVIIENTNADFGPICSMVVSQFGRWIQSRYSVEEEATSPDSVSTCLNLPRSSRSAASASTLMLLRSHVRVCTTDLNMFPAPSGKVQPCPAQCGAVASDSLVPSWIYAALPLRYLWSKGTALPGCGQWGSVPTSWRWCWSAGWSIYTTLPANCVIPCHSRVDLCSAPNPYAEQGLPDGARREGKGVNAGPSSVPLCS